MYYQSIVIQKKTKMLWPKYCITKVNKVLYSNLNKDVWPKHCITKVNKDVCMYYKVLYYKSKQRCMTKVLSYKSKQWCMTKVLYYKSKQSIVLQK